jgi:drug/metabolite transporter (DMT)-like permease
MTVPTETSPPLRQTDRVPGRIAAFLAIGLLALSQAGNIIRMADAGPVAITAFRLLLAAFLLLPFCARRLPTLSRLNRMDVLILLAAQVAMVLHFFSWIYAVQHTTIASATLCFSINPMTTAVLAWFFFKETASPGLVASIVAGVIGVAVIGASDLRLSPDALWGNLSAILSAVLFSLYLIVARRIRKKLDADVYVTVLYGGAALIAFGVLLGTTGRISLDYSAITWAGFLAMAVVPTIIGHTSLNAASKYMNSGRISAYTLVEPLLAAVVACFVWNESITVFGTLGYAFICVSVILLVTENRSATEKTPLSGLRWLRWARLFGAKSP